MAGFLAASYLRGIGFVQVPTTLLSQVDSSVGGKVGVNLKAGKNLVGAFYQPRLVLCDLNTIKTLPKRELRAGLAEVIKYGIIEDSKLFKRLERKMSDLLNLDTIEMAYIVARSCQIKAKIVEQDETENGLRAILNYGHTIGHALEAISSYGKFLHGEAISIGQVAASKISRDLHGLSQSEVDRIEALFTAAGLPTKIHLSKNEIKKLLAAMKLDKKVSDGKVNFVLASAIGKVSFGIESPEATIKASLT
jgi:3-dehydroquinate synthase